MCARIFLTITEEELADFLEVSGLPALRPRYNICPGEDILVVGSGPSGDRRGWLARWGLVPRWAKDQGIGQRLINARSETADRRPAFRDSLRDRRCVIPAGGFYEWKKIGRLRQPYAIRVQDGLLAMAGLWDTWQGSDGRVIPSCTVLTTSANETVAPIHDRMPVILGRDAVAVWLDPDRGPGEIAALMRPFPAERMSALPVSRRVNRPGFDDPSCLTPAEEAEPQGRLFT